MTPYYEDDACTIYHGDCREILPTLHDVGLVLTSPPYNLGGAVSSGTYFRSLRDGYGTHDDAMEDDAYRGWQQDVLRACWAALADDGGIFYNHFYKPRKRERDANGRVDD